MQRMTAYEETALRGILGLSETAAIPDSAREVWTRMNDKFLSANANLVRRYAVARKHAIRLEEKLAERRAEFMQTMVVGVIISKCRRYILSCEIDGDLFLPGTVMLTGDTAGETYAAVANGVGVVTDAPRELGVMRDVTEGGLKLARVYLGAFQKKDDKSTQLRQVQWFHIGDNRINDKERAVINYLLES